MKNSKENLLKKIAISSYVTTTLTAGVLTFNYLNNMMYDNPQKMEAPLYTLQGLVEEVEIGEMIRINGKEVRNNTTNAAKWKRNARWGIAGGLAWCVISILNAPLLGKINGPVDYNAPKILGPFSYD